MEEEKIYKDMKSKTVTTLLKLESDSIRYASTTEILKKRKRHGEPAILQWGTDSIMDSLQEVRSILTWSSIIPRLCSMKGLLQKH